MSAKLRSAILIALLLLPAGALYGQGLKGEYFPNMTLAGQPTLTRVENVGFNWLADGPGDPIAVDSFSVRWTGSLTPPESGQYIFGTRTDDGLRLSVAGEIIINNWTDHSAVMNRSQPVALYAGEPVAIKLEYYENGGDAVCELYWSGPGIEEQIIPVEFFSETIVQDFRARQPSPANGAMDVSPIVPLLTWTAGPTAMFHTVYLSTSPDLTDADRVATDQFPALYYHLPGITPGTTYYWRVDEKEKDLTTVHTGKVWSFTVQALTAYNPNPSDKTTDASVTPDLRWLPGAGAGKHQVYFSENLDAVTQGAEAAKKATLTPPDANFAPGSLDEMTTYYWRVDEILSDGSATAGPVWSFTTCLPIDDFESYTDDDGSRIYQTWSDGPVNGTGSMAGYLDAPFTESEFVHGGKQSMPLDFNNINTPFYSEVERELAGTQDLTKGGANTLVLYVRGKLLNPPTQLYIAIEDTAGHTATVKHPDPAIAKTLSWNAWKIPLTEFAGVNAARVKTIYIGLGDKDNPVKGGNGLIFVDDVCASKEILTP